MGCVCRPEDVDKTFIEGGRLWTCQAYGPQRNPPQPQAKTPRTFSYTSRTNDKNTPAADAAGRPHNNRQDQDLDSGADATSTVTSRQVARKAGNPILDGKVAFDCFLFHLPAGENEKPPDRRPLVDNHGANHAPQRKRQQSSHFPVPNRPPDREIKTGSSTCLCFDGMAPLRRKIL